MSDICVKASVRTCNPFYFAKIFYVLPGLSDLVLRLGNEYVHV